MKIQAFLLLLIITSSASSQVFIHPCIDSKNVDFWFCEIAMGIGVLGDEFLFISGYGCVKEGLEYNPKATADHENFVFPDCMSNCIGDTTGDDIVSVQDEFEILCNFGTISE